ncbi:MAG: phage tail tube protein [Pacificimonas sp.]
MTNARIGLGTQFWLDDDGDTLTKLTELTGITTPNFQREDVEATHFESAGQVREYIAGLIDPGEGEYTFNLVPGDDTDLLLQAALDDGTARDYEVILPTNTAGTTQKFAGTCIVKGIERDIPIDDRMTMTVNVRYTGAVTITTETA